MADKAGITIPEAEKKIFSEGGRAGSLKGKFLDVEEIANAVLYLASNLSTATNGACIRAEGGLLKHT